jgi:hypothetical protein
MPRCCSVALTTLALLFISGAAHADETDNKIPDDLQTMLAKAEQLQLLALSLDRRVKPKPENAFHGWKVRGQTSVKEVEVRNKLVAAFQRGVAENKGIAAACFRPRHGLRVTHWEEERQFRYLLRVPRGACVCEG